MTVAARRAMSTREVRSGPPMLNVLAAAEVLVYAGAVA